MDRKENMEEGLMDHLSSPNMDKNILRQYSGFISNLQKQNLKVERIWWDGQPWPDIMVAQTRIRVKEIGNLAKVFEQKKSRIDGLEIFPLGIPFPEELMVNIRAPRINPINQNVSQGG